MKRDTLFKYKEFVVTYEEIMTDVKEYQKLLDSSTKLEKTQGNTWNEKMCGFCYKPRHLKKCCHWNSKNPNNKLKDKKEVLVNEISPKWQKQWVIITINRGTETKGVPQCIIVTFVI
jgi:hypothetical protein